MMNRINAKANELKVDLFMNIFNTNDYSAVAYTHDQTFIAWLKENATEIHDNHYTVDGKIIKIVDDEF